MPIMSASRKTSLIYVGLPSPCMVYMSFSAFMTRCMAYRLSSTLASTTSPVRGLCGGTSITLSRLSSRNGRMLYPRTVIVTLSLPSSLNMRVISCIRLWLSICTVLLFSFINQRFCLIVVQPPCRGGTRGCVRLYVQALLRLWSIYAYVLFHRTLVCYMNRA